MSTAKLAGATQSGDADAKAEEQAAARAQLKSYWDHPATRFARRNATPLTTAAAFGLVVLKILAVAQYNAAVAAALVGTTDSPAVVFDVALYVAPIVLGLGWVLAVTLAFSARSLSQQARAAIYGAAIAGTFVVVVAVPLLFVALLVSALVFEYLVAPLSEWVGRRPAFPEWPRGRRDLKTLYMTAGWMVAFLVLPAMVVASPPWMSAERVTLPGGRVMVAYVVRTDGNWTLLLSDRGRQLEYVPATSVLTRQPCSIAASTVTLIELLNGPQLPPCYP